MANPFVHVELNTTDIKKAKSFYRGLFDWQLEDVPMPEGSYTMIEVGEGTGGGLMKHPMPGAPSTWLAHVLVDGVAAVTAKAKALRATVLKDVASSAILLARSSEYGSPRCKGTHCASSSRTGSCRSGHQYSAPHPRF